jgi:hypothetical protein
MYILAGQRNDFYLSDMWQINLDDFHYPLQLTSDYSMEGGPAGAFTQRATCKLIMKGSQNTDFGNSRP